MTAIFIDDYAASSLNSSILGQVQKMFLSPYTLSTLATGGQNLLTFKNFINVNYWQFNGSIKCTANTYKCKS